ncbi:MAG: acyl-CoA dehydrogenase family protein [Burkholderiaceae bacterium]
MAIDFTASPGARAAPSPRSVIVERVVKPGEAKIGNRDDIERADSREDPDPHAQEAQNGPRPPHSAEGMGRHGARPPRPPLQSEAEAAKSSYGPWVLNCQALMRATCTPSFTGATDAQKEKYLRPLCEGRGRELLGHDRARGRGLRPDAYPRAPCMTARHLAERPRWFISNANRASFAILIARTEDNPDPPQAGNTGFIVDIPSEGLGARARGRDHARRDRLRDPHRQSQDSVNMLGGRGQGHRLGQYRLGPARLAHCMRWIAQAETALDMMVDRRCTAFAHGSVLAEKQGIQWMIADSAMELYQAKLMVLHAAYKIDKGEDFVSEVSMGRSTSSPTR